MFKKLFSCFGEAPESQQMDLSGQPISNHNKPQMHPESNVNGKEINFEIEDMQSSELHHHFLQSAAFNSGGISSKKVTLCTLILV